MALVKFNAGTSHPVILEKWTQMKDGSGNLTDTLVERVTAYANIERTGSTKDLEDHKIKEQDTYKMILRNRSLKIDGVWKVVYRGKRHAVISKERLGEKKFEWLLIVQSK